MTGPHSLHPRIGDILLTFFRYDPEPLYIRYLAEDLAMNSGDVTRRIAVLLKRGILETVEDPAPETGRRKNGPHFYRLTGPGKVLASQPLTRSLSYELTERPVVLTRRTVTYLRYALAEYPMAFRRSELCRHTGLSLGAASQIGAKLRRSDLLVFEDETGRSPSGLLLTSMGLELARQCSHPELPLEIFPG